MIISGPKTLTLPLALGGDDSIYALTVVCATRGLIVKDSPGATIVQIEGIKDTNLVTIGIVQLLLSKGAEVYDYPAFFEITDPTAICPFGDGVETWETWGTFGESHKPTKLGSKWYRSSAIGESGELLPASTWAAKISGGLKVLSQSQYQVIQQQNSPKII